VTGKAEEIWFDAFAQSNADNVRGKTKTRNILRGTKGQVRNILTGPENAFGGKETDGQGFIVSRRSHSDRNATGHGKVILTSISETYLKRFLDRNKVLHNLAFIAVGSSNTNTLGCFFCLVH
jgi:hypothetical protein